MKTAVDTNVLFDLLAGDANAATSAYLALSDVSAAGPVVMCPVVYAELAAGFANPKEIIKFLHDLQISIETFSNEALLEAAVAWRRYTASRGKQVQCPQCGSKAIIHCPTCRASLAWRQHIITDFLVGGHASQQADRLLTRDTGYYRTYFPALRLVSPAQITS